MPFRDELESRVEALSKRVDELTKRLDVILPQGMEDLVTKTNGKDWRKARFARRDLIYKGREQCSRCEHYDSRRWKIGENMGNSKKWTKGKRYAPCLLNYNIWNEWTYNCDQFYPAKRFWRVETN